jgi:hypothetical protein
LTWLLEIADVNNVNLANAEKESKFLLKNVLAQRISGFPNGKYLNLGGFTTRCLSDMLELFICYKKHNIWETVKLMCREFRSKGSDFPSY